MNHPIIFKRTNGLLYTIISIIIGISQFILLHYFFKIETQIAAIDSVVYCSIFALIGLSIWFMVYYNDIEKNSLWIFILSHIISSTIVVAVWIIKSRFILSTFVEENKQYNFIQDNFLYLRIIQGYLGYIIIVLLYYVLVFYQTTIDNKEREQTFKTLLRDAELTSLKSQINPHFLFNSLNSISSLTMFDAEKAQAMIIKLSDYLRFSLQFKANDTVTFKEEIENIHRYLEIEKIRFGNRLNMEFDIPNECHSLLVPTMILQPLFENAIKYGVHESTEETLIKVQAIKESNYTRITISNNYDPESIPSAGQGIGLSNIKERMQLLYGSSELVTIINGNNTFTVTLYFPDTSILS